MWMTGTEISPCTCWVCVIFCLKIATRCPFWGGPALPAWTPWSTTASPTWKTPGSTYLQDSRSPRSVTWWRTTQVCAEPRTLPVLQSAPSVGPLCNATPRLLPQTPPTGCAAGWWSLASSGVWTVPVRLGLFPWPSGDPPSTGGTLAG